MKTPLVPEEFAPNKPIRIHEAGKKRRPRREVNGEEFEWVEDSYLPTVLRHQCHPTVASALND